jgi:hypothetical protein
MLKKRSSPTDSGSKSWSLRNRITSLGCIDEGDDDVRLEFKSITNVITLSATLSSIHRHHPSTDIIHLPTHPSSELMPELVFLPQPQAAMLGARHELRELILCESQSLHSYMRAMLMIFSQCTRPLAHA